MQWMKQHNTPMKYGIKIIVTLSMPAFLLWTSGRQLHAQPKVATAGAFEVGATWKDEDGQVINAHGGNIIYQKGTYYWFGEKRGQHRSQGVNVYSSNDLCHWKLRGLALAQLKDTVSDIAEGCIMERPKVIYNKKTRKYVLWFHLELRGKGYSAARVGIAVSDNITGPYKYLHSLRPNGNMSRDMALFVDSDEKAYEIYSSRENYDLRVAELTPDYLQVTAKDSMLFSMHREAPAIFCYDHKYYLITSGCTGWTPNSASLSVADDLYGPWKVMGNPMAGPGREKTFGGQPTFILPVRGTKDKFIYMGDKWNPKDLRDSRYQFLPIQISGDSVTIPWMDHWRLQDFVKK